jgi:hypothetical protein
MCADFDLLNLICYCRPLRFKLYHTVGSFVTYLLLCVILSIQAAERVNEQFNTNKYDTTWDKMV